jgi:glycosyltransferase involved in cell wall biosynthesis
VTDIITPYAIAVFSALATMCDLTVLFCARSGSRGLEWTNERLPFEHRVVSGITLKRRSPNATDFYPDPRIVWSLARSRPDAIISGAFSFPSLYAAMYASLTRRPLLIHSDGTAFSERGIGVGQRLLRTFFARVSQGAVGNSTPAARRFVELGWPAERVYLAPHSTRIAALHDVARARRYRRGAQLVVLCVTRLIPRKGVDRLISAASSARQAGADVALVVAGDGPEAPALRRRATDAHVPVEWLGLVQPADLPSVYASADAFAFPTLDDPFGIALLEAAAAGLPLVASPHGGATHELVRDGVNGIVADPADVDSWTSALIRLAGDAALRERLGAAAFSSTIERTPEATARGYLAAVEQSIDRGRRRG